MSRKIDRVDVLAKHLPVELRSFKQWYYSEGGQPTGLRDYMTAVTVWIDEELGTPKGAVLATKVMAAAGLTPADWYRRMLS
jgi:hypothetical protein